MQCFDQALISPGWGCNDFLRFIHTFFERWIPIWDTFVPRCNCVCRFDVRFSFGNNYSLQNVNTNKQKRIKTQNTKTDNTESPFSLIQDFWIWTWEVNGENLNEESEGCSTFNMISKWIVFIEVQFLSQGKTLSKRFFQHEKYNVWRECSVTKDQNEWRHDQCVTLESPDDAFWFTPNEQ